MSLINEAAYLYVYSKKIITVNTKIHSMREDGRKELQKFHQATDSDKKQKHQHQSEKVSKKLQELLEERQKILTKLRRHQVAFAGQLQKEAST